MRRLSALAASAALVLFLAAPAWAQAHKCQTPSGPVTYSDQPCASAQAGGPITLRPNSMDGSEGRAQDQRAAAAQAASSAAPPANRTGCASSHHSNSWASMPCAACKPSRSAWMPSSLSRNARPLPAPAAMKCAPSRPGNPKPGRCANSAPPARLPAAKNAAASRDAWHQTHQKQEQIQGAKKALRAVSTRTSRYG